MAPESSNDAKAVSKESAPGGCTESEAAAPDQTKPTVESTVSVVVDNPDESEAPDGPNVALLTGWRKPRDRPTLEEISTGSAGVWECSSPCAHCPLVAPAGSFMGLGFIVSVGYMDPGNWATDLSGGSAYGYTLLIVVLLANFCAIFLQSMALRMGVAAERDLAQACRDAYSKFVVYFLWIMMEIAIAATDLAEIIGSATALNLLFGLPLWAGVLITAVDVLVVLLLGVRSFRIMEFFIFILVLLVCVCFAYELGVAKPNWADVGKGFIPRSKILTNPGILYNAIGILGATVMPHNLFLHSSIIQTRAYNRNNAGKRSAIKYGTIDTLLSLSAAFFINASMLILAASVFFYAPEPKQEVAYISDAYRLLEGSLGSAAQTIFAVALLACGQNSAITGTLAGQVVMEGFIQIKLKPWMRRALTRGIAIIPAAVVAAIYGDAGAGKLLVLSQVILSLTLVFAVAPLVHMTSDKRKMGTFVNGWPVKIIAGLLTLVLAGLNLFLIVQSVKENEFGGAVGI